MQWINISQGTIVRPEFTRAEPIDQATWLNLLAYCCNAENGGLMEGAVNWSEREWLINCRIERSQVIGKTCGLWRTIGEDIRVYAYPADQEAKVKEKRRLGSKGGRKSAASRSQPASDLANAQANGCTEGKKVSNGTETSRATGLRLHHFEPVDSEKSLDEVNAFLEQEGRKENGAESNDGNGNKEKSPSRNESCAARRATLGAA